jgi:hypothetical protein
MRHLPWLGNACILLVVAIEKLKGSTTASSFELLSCMLKTLAREYRSVADCLEEGLDVHLPGNEFLDVRIRRCVLGGMRCAVSTVVRDGAPSSDQAILEDRSLNVCESGPCKEGNAERRNDGKILCDAHLERVRRLSVGVEGRVRFGFCFTNVR